MKQILLLIILAVALTSCFGPGPSAQEQIEQSYNAIKDRHFPALPDCSVEEALQLLAGDRAIFVDARDPAEMNVSMLPGAVKPESVLAQKPDKVLIFYCTIGLRSGHAAEQFATNGYQTRNLRGGILAWVQAGQPVYRDGKIVKRVHVYGQEWDLLPADYEAVY